MHRILALIERDLRRFRRSPTLIVVSMVMPLVQLVVLGYAFGGKIKELRVTFNVPMDAGFSWTGGGEHYPKIPEGKGPSWTKDHKTCILPVELQPDWEYRLGLNSLSFKNFQSAGGIPLEPVEYSFKTKNKLLTNPN